MTQPGLKFGNTITAVLVLPRFRVRLTYADGYIGELDFRPYIEWGEAMIPLRDPEFFATAHIGSGGSSLEWTTPDGEQIDFDANGLRMDLEGTRKRPLSRPAAE